MEEMARPTDLETLRLLPPLLRRRLAAPYRPMLFWALAVAAFTGAALVNRSLPRARPAAAAPIEEAAPQAEAATPAPGGGAAEETSYTLASGQVRGQSVQVTQLGDTEVRVSEGARQVRVEGTEDGLAVYAAETEGAAPLLSATNLEGGGLQVKDSEGREFFSVRRDENGEIRIGSGATPLYRIKLKEAERKFNVYAGSGAQILRGKLKNGSYLLREPEPSETELGTLTASTLELAAALATPLALEQRALLIAWSRTSRSGASP